MNRRRPAVARTRTAVRAALDGLPRGATVLVACSGGADSLALAHAAAFVAPRLLLRCGLVTVDHGLQVGSAERAAAVAAAGRAMGMAFADVETVTVGRAGGPEAAARTARYAALDAVKERHDAVLVLLGHTRDDQAETVLLALARGSGPRALAGMPRRRGHYARPFLDLPRTDTVDACAALGVEPWDDPHNVDPAFTRARARAAMPVLVDVFGARFVGNLARTAMLVAEDVRALDGLADDALAAALVRAGDVSTEARGGRRGDVVVPKGSPGPVADVSADARGGRRGDVSGPERDGDGGVSIQARGGRRGDVSPDGGPGEVGPDARGGRRGDVEAATERLPMSYADDLGVTVEPDIDAVPGAVPRVPAVSVARLRDLPRAIRTRALHRWVVAAGANDAELGFVHIDAMDALVARWRGQGPTNLPGGITVSRKDGLLHAARTTGISPRGVSDVRRAW